MGVGSLASFGTLNKPKYNEETGQKSTYYNEEVKIKGVTPCPDNKVRLLWRPEWFTKAFNPQTLDKGALFVYKRNIASIGEASFLEGLCGGEENLDVLSDMCKDLGEAPEPEAVHAVLAGFLRDLGPIPFIYVQQQERKVTGVDDDGKKIRTATTYYEVDGIMPLTDEYAKKMVNRAKYNVKRRAKALEDGVEQPAPWKFKTDFADYGLAVEMPETAEPAWVA